ESRILRQGGVGVHEEVTGKQEGVTLRQLYGGPTAMPFQRPRPARVLDKQQRAALLTAYLDHYRAAATADPEALNRNLPREAIKLPRVAALPAAAEGLRDVRRRAAAGGAAVLRARVPPPSAALGQAGRQAALGRFRAAPRPRQARRAAEAAGQLR